MATVQFGASIATIDGYKWRSANLPLASLLNARLPIYGASGADPNPDLTAAQEAAKALGGAILDEGEPMESIEGRIY